MLEIGNCVEVCVVTYNRLEYVQACLSSIMSYTGVPLKIVVCDNGSTDGTKEYLELLHRKRLIHKVIFNRENLGIAESKNQLVRALEWESDFFILTDSDIVFPYGNPCYIKCMLEILNRHPQCGVLNLNFESHYVPEESKWWFEKQKESHRLKKDDLILLESGFWGSMITRKTIEEVQKFNKLYYKDPSPFRCRSLYGETDEMFRLALSKMNIWGGVAKNLIGINLGWNDKLKFGDYHMFKKIQRVEAERKRREEERDS